MVQFYLEPGVILWNTELDNVVKYQINSIRLNKVNTIATYIEREQLI